MIDSLILRKDIIKPLCQKTNEGTRNMKMAVKLSKLYLQWPKIIRVNGLTQLLFKLVYHSYFKSKTEILVFRNTFLDSNERIFWVEALTMQNIVYKQQIEKG